MEFFAVNGKRPVRLSEATRKFAYESLGHKYGLLTKETPSVLLDGYEGFADLTPLQKYDIAIRKIAEESPIRICEGEKISGAATLGNAIYHIIPASFQDKAVCGSVSHLTIDFETVLKKGVNYIAALAEQSLEKYKGSDRQPFAESCVNCIDAMRDWHGRYLKELECRDEYKDNYNNLKKVPFEPAESFYEAVQSLWFTFAFVRLCGNWPGIGRIDCLLGNYLEKDLANGKITLEEAREILAHFFIKGCEWVCGGNYGSGDAQHYQNIVLGGVDEKGNEVTNNVTYLVLDILEEFGISDFPTTVRLNKNSDKKLLSRVADVVRLGGGIVAVYNEDLIIDSLVNYGYELKEARKFANDGCWEVQIPGKTYFIYQPFDSLQILQYSTLNKYEDCEFASFEELYQKFAKDLKERVKALGRDHLHHFIHTGVPTKDWKWKPSMPCTVVSVFEQGCIEKGLSYFEGGPIYNMISPHIGGLPDTVNSLYAIKKLVFDEKKLTFAEFMDVLKNNWEGYEPLRRYVLDRYSYFGNDNDEVDSIAVRIVEDFADACDSIRYNSGYMTPAGISTFGRQLEWAPYRLSTPSGKKAHEILSGNFSPTPGTDKDGATAIIKSYCKANLGRTVSGAALDIKLLPGIVNAENGVDVLVTLFEGFVALGGHFMQLDIADTELLKEAQKHPEDYQNLSVRVSGWNARFVTLNKEWQDMIIAQTGSKI
ncbi:MAG: hypothetical protein E7633_02300 [Ruminococcaceae bacterium]|nr:hypothetical protein [Oscillospiraceae bacterium]